MGYRVSFASCWAKLDRAKAHRDALETYVAETFRVQANRPTLWAELDEESGYHVYRIKTMPDIDPILVEIGLRVGDIVQNIRAALDHVTWQLACAFTNDAVVKETRVQFPIVTTRFAADGTDLWNAARKRNLSEVDPLHAAQIEGYQPYHGIKGRPDSYTVPYVHQLAQLQELSNADKHRVLNAVLATPNHFSPVYPEGAVVQQRSVQDWARDHGMPDIEAAPGMTMEDMRFDHAGEIAELNAEVCRIAFVGTDLPRKMEMAGDVTPQIALAKGGPAIPALDRIAGFATLIVSEFEPLF